MNANLMTSSRPYLVRAMYEWIIDNHLTPYILVNAQLPEVVVPQRFVEDGKIILNIEPQVIARLRLGNDAIEFDARFSGVSQHLFIPILAIKAIYAFENGRGMVFGEEAHTDDPTHTVGKKPRSPKGKPDLKIVK